MRPRLPTAFTALSALLPLAPSPASARVGVVPSVELSQSYTDRSLYLDTRAPPQPEAATSVSPALRIRYERPRLELHGGASVGFSFRSRAGDRRDMGASAGFGYELAPSWRMSAGFGASLATERAPELGTTTQDAAVPDSVSQENVATGVTYSQVAAGVGVAHDWDERTIARASLTTTRLQDYKSDELPLETGGEPYVLSILGLSARRSVTAATALSGAWELQLHQFDVEGQTIAQKLTAGWERRVSQQLSVFAEAGVAFGFRTDISTDPTVTFVPAARAGLSVNRARLGLYLEGKREVILSPAVQGTAVADSVELRPTYRLLPDLEVLGLLRGARIEAVLRAEDDEDLTSLSYTAGLELRYSLASAVQLAVAARRYVVVPTVGGIVADGLDYEANSASAVLTAAWE
jgi:hypothetical protein